jgi:hypothetical protein
MFTRFGELVSQGDNSQLSAYNQKKILKKRHTSQKQSNRKLFIPAGKNLPLVSVKQNSNKKNHHRKLKKKIIKKIKRARLRG